VASRALRAGRTLTNYNGAAFLKGDFDADGDVDGDDFRAWQSGFGTPNGAAHGDADTDGDVDGDDFLAWPSQFGSGGGRGAITADSGPSCRGMAVLANCAAAAISERVLGSVRSLCSNDRSS
jgi:hypothetical protein